MLGMKGSTFPARKALQQSRRLGTERVRRAVELLAAADLDLRGVGLAGGDGDGGPRRPLGSPQPALSLSLRPRLPLRAATQEGRPSGRS